MAEIREETEIQLQMQAYLDRAIDYYIFARKAIMLTVIPVGGSLFHIAIEMILHCGLSTKYSQAELERRFSKHELPDMWSEFKKVFRSTKLSKFDQFVNNNRQWKELRYPKSNSRGWAVLFGRKKPEPKVLKSNMANLSGRHIRIEINLEEMDEFMTTVINALDINPGYIQLHLQRSDELQKLYLEENTHPLFRAGTKVISPAGFKL